MANDKYREDARAFLEMNCGRCGKKLRVRLADIDSTARFFECEACAKRPPFNTRQVLVAFDQRRTDPPPSD